MLREDAALRNEVTLFLVLSTVGLVNCRRPPDEEQILRWLEQAIADCEHGRSRELSARLTSGFELGDRPLHQLQVRRLIQYALSHTQGRRFYYPRPQISISEDGDRAEVGFPFLLTGASGGRSEKDAAHWLLEIADKTHLLRVSLRLERDGENWLVRGARIERFTGLEFKTVDPAAGF